MSWQNATYFACCQLIRVVGIHAASRGRHKALQLCWPAAISRQEVEARISEFKRASSRSILVFITISSQAGSSPSILDHGIGLDTLGRKQKKPPVREENAGTQAMAAARTSTS